MIEGQKIEFKSLPVIEGQEIEFKQEYTDHIKREVVAFLNTNDGTVYIGVDDHGKVIGVDDVDSVMQRVSSALRGGICPDCTQFFRLDAMQQNGKWVVCIHVIRGTQTPYYLSDKGLRSNGVYLRIGNTSVPAQEESIRKLLRRSEVQPYEQKKAARQDLTFSSAAQVFSARQLEFGPAQMRTLGLIDEEGFFTNLGLLLSDQCEHTVKCAIFEGTTKAVFKDRKEFTGSLFAQIDLTLEYLNVYNKTAAVIGSKLRQDLRDYPPIAVREALLNAVVHREYSFSGSTFVNLYEDRLEILSLGGLPDGVSVEAILMGISQPRNRRLAEVFYRLNYIEAYGTGIPRIWECYRGSGQKPDIKIIEGVFRIQLPNLLFGRRSDFEGLSSQEQTILSFLREHGEIDKETAAELLGTKPPRAYSVLRAMTEKKLLSAYKVGKKFVYRL